MKAAQINTAILETAVKSEVTEERNLRLSFVLRCMLFSMPVQVAALISVGVTAREILALEGLFLLGTSLSQMFGAYLNDAISSKAAFGVGKGCAAIACLLIGLIGSPTTIPILFFLWGASVGIYDGSDFLTAKRPNATWAHAFRNVEVLGFYGSIASFVVGGFLFSKFGFRAIFLANAFASILIPILLFSGVSADRTRSLSRPKLELKKWGSDFKGFPLFFALSYALSTVALKSGMISIQESLISLGVASKWNGWIFVALTIFALILVKLSPNKMRSLLGLSLLICASAFFLHFGRPMLALSVVLVTILVRVAHKIVFFSHVADESKHTLIGRNTSLAQVVAGIVLIVGSHSFKEASLVVLILSTLGALIFAKLGQRKRNLQWIK